MIRDMRFTAAMAAFALIALVGGSAQAGDVHGLLVDLHGKRASINAGNLHEHNLGGLLNLHTDDTGQVYVGLIGRGNQGARRSLEARGFEIPSFYDGKEIFTARAPLDGLSDLASVAGLASLRPAFKRQYKLDQSVPDMYANGDRFASAFRGAGTVVGVVDSGVDALHPDFDDGAGGSRVSLYWDQVTTNYQGDAHSFCSANCCDCNPSSVGHGTHVASTAAGNHGVASEAEVIGVETTMYENAILDGVNWIFAQAGGKPTVVNLSLGGHFDPHNGKSDFDRGLDEAVSDASGNRLPGRAVVVANGNEGEDRLHADYDYSSRGESFAFEFTVPAYTPNSGESNDLVLIDAWFDANDALKMYVVTPSGERLGPWRTPNAFGGWHTDDGTVAAEVAQTTTYDGGEDNIYIQIYDGRSGGSNTPAPGVWRVEFQMDRVRGGGSASAPNSIDAWLAYTSMWGAEFSGPNGNNDTSVGSPATAHSVIAVGAYTTKLDWTPIPAAAGYDTNGDGFVSYCELGRDYDPFGNGCDRIYIGEYASFTSHGPTVDGRTKPDVSAPGVGIIAATSAGVVNTPYIISRSGVVRGFTGAHNVLQGTSMSCPHVAGAVSLLFEAYPGYTVDDARNKLKSTAVAQAGSANIWGAGKVDLGAALPSGTPNDPPVAMDDAYGGTEDTPITVAAPGVLGNDTDAEGDALTAVLANAPSNGSLTLNADGGFVYTPDADFNGVDSFSYQANDGTGSSAFATVSLTLAAVNDAPVAADDAYDGTEDTPLSVAAPGVLDNDSDADADALTASLVSGPTNGSITLDADGGFVYTPDAGFIGADAFTYKVHDGTVDSATASVDLTIQAAGGDITLSITTSKDKGTRYAHLSWSGANTANVDVYRNGSLLQQTPNDGEETINNGSNKATVYKVCETGAGGACSNDAMAVW